MGKLSASTVSAIVMMVTFVATDTTVTPGPTPLAPTLRYDIATMPLDSAAFNCTPINTSEKNITHSAYCLTVLYYPITRANAMIPSASQHNIITVITVAYATPSPSPCYTSDDIQHTATVTTFIESCGAACKSNTKRADIAAGLVGGFIGSVFGIVLTVLVTAAAAILITKWHKNRYV